MQRPEQDVWWSPTWWSPAWWSPTTRSGERRTGPDTSVVGFEDNGNHGLPESCRCLDSGTLD